MDFQKHAVENSKLMIFNVRIPHKIMFLVKFAERKTPLKIIFYRKKPIQKKAYNGAYSVKKKRYVKDRNYQAVANGGNEIV